MRSYVYLHGFASGPSSSKALFFRDRLAAHGVEMAIPALDEGDFESLTLTKQLGVVERTTGDKPVVLLGSSMGGYLAALYAQARAKVERLVLLAPAFNFSARWAERVGAEEIDKWRATDRLDVFHYAQNRRATVGYALFEDATQYPAYPRIGQPTLILHGKNDDVVSPESSAHFCEINLPQAQLHLFDSGHELTNVLEPMWELVEPFLFS